MTSGTLRGALSDVPLKLLGISDAVPHLLYGTVTTAVLRTGEA